MSPIFINFIALCILAVLATHLTPLNKNRMYFLGISFLMLLFIRSCVYVWSVPDLEIYYRIYNQLLSVDFLDVPFVHVSGKLNEVGFRYLFKICGMLTSSFQIFLVIFGILWLACYYTTITRYTRYVVVAVLILTLEAFDQSIFVIRQHLAVGVVFLSYKYIINKSLPKYLLMIALAYSLHHTAVIALPLYFIYNVKGRKTLLLAVGVVAVAAVWVVSNVATLGRMDMMNEYSSYIADTKNKTNMTPFLLITLECALYVYALRGKIWEEGINRLLFISLLVGMILLFMGLGFNPTVRLSMYYASIAFLVIPKALEYLPGKWMRRGVTLFFIALYIYKAYFGSNIVYLENYKTIFQ